MDAVPGHGVRARPALRAPVLALLCLCAAAAPARAQLGVPLDPAERLGGGPSASALEAGASGVVATRPAGPRSTGFRRLQLGNPRVRAAHDQRASDLRALLRERDLIRPVEVFFRVFKREQELEVWARDRGDREFTLVRSYPVCELSGRLGPKRHQGDLQVPEGFYSVDLFNPWSEYHLSLRIDYPNAVDRARSRSAGSPGGDIFIHGGCATIGCVPITDEWIEEVYLLAMDARDAGQKRIPVHIFPTRLDASGMQWLRATYGPRYVDFPFWRDLQQGFLAFERSHTVPRVTAHDGRYLVLPEPAVAPVSSGILARHPLNRPLPGAPFAHAVRRLL